MRRALVALLVLSAAPALTGCPPRLLPGTEIRDTPESREVLDVIDAYRRALNDRNVEAVMKLVSKSFFETSGTPEGHDDYDYAGLEKKLQEWASKVTSVRVAIEVKNIFFDDDQRARAQYFYDTNYQLAPVTEGGPSLWKHDADTKEMVFKHEGGAWRIVGGI